MGKPIVFDEGTRERIYRGYVCNLRELKGSRKIVKKWINQLLRHGNEVELRRAALLYAVLYSMTSESTLMKTITGENGFSPSEIHSILAERSLELKWKNLPSWLRIGLAARSLVITQT